VDDLVAPSDGGMTVRGQIACSMQGRPEPSSREVVVSQAPRTDHWDEELVEEDLPPARRYPDVLAKERRLLALLRRIQGEEWIARPGHRDIPSPAAQGS